MWLTCFVDLQFLIVLSCFLFPSLIPVAPSSMLPLLYFTPLMFYPSHILPLPCFTPPVFYPNPLFCFCIIWWSPSTYYRPTHPILPCLPILDYCLTLSSPLTTLPHSVSNSVTISFLHILVLSWLWPSLCCCFSLFILLCLHMPPPPSP